MSCKLLLVLSVLLVLTSCGYKKSSDENSSPVPPSNSSNTNPKATNPQNPPSDTSGGLRPVLPLPSDKNVPAVSFVQTRVETNSKREAEVELELSQPALVPVIVEVFLQNGSALYHRDYTGFKLHTASVRAETRQILIFAPKKRRLRLPLIGIRNTSHCDSEFYVKINRNLKQARVVNNTARISIPCTLN